MARRDKGEARAIAPKKHLLGLLSKGAILLLIVLPAWSWGTIAILFASPGPKWLQLCLAVVFAALLPAIFLSSRSFYRAVPLSLIPLVLLLLWWQTLQPSGDKEWAADVARVAHGEISGSRLTMHNVRNFRYTSEDDFNEVWEVREYDLEKLQGLDLFLSYWASEHIAHVIMSWDFGHDEHLAISIETRKDVSQEYSALKGFFKQFELAYVAGDERDLIRLRTNFRRERVYAYRLNVTPERARALLEDYLLQMNSLTESPQFYDALTRNCTTAIHLHTRAINPDDPLPFDWRILVSGHLDHLLHERKIVANGDLPFATLRQRSRVDLRMQEHGNEGFSEILRDGLP
ncbi:MAG: DUF4105 domain-containing protein [Thermodesulfobacteriota bacterium]